jgi:hypothetical protein
MGDEVKFLSKLNRKPAPADESSKALNQSPAANGLGKREVAVLP